MEDDKLQKAINLGNAVKAAFDSGLLREAFNAVEDDLTAQWKLTTDEYKQRQIWQEVHGLHGIASKFRKFVTDGEIARQKLEEANK